MTGREKTAKPLPGGCGRGSCYMDKHHQVGLAKGIELMGRFVIIAIIVIAIAVLAYIYGVGDVFTTR